MDKYQIPSHHTNTKWVIDHFRYINDMDKKLTNEQKVMNSPLTDLSRKYKEHTDKGPDGSYAIKHNYTEIYDKLLRPYKNQNINFLEIGIRWGGSLLMWRDFFPDAKIYGIDIAPTTNKEVLSSESIETFVFNAYDTNSVEKHLADVSFDAIIDDGSHQVQDQIKMLNLWYKKLKPNGIIIIEDIQTISDAKTIIKNFNGPINRCSIIDRTHCVPSLDDINVVYYA